MRVGLVIYGSLEVLSGGYLYDRIVVDHLRSAGDEVDIISLPWRNYLRHLMDNFNMSLIQRLLETPFDVLIQDELNHPSLIRINRLLRKNASYPIVSIIHLLRCTEPRPAWQNVFYRWLEKSYLRSVDAFIFNSQTTRRAVMDLINSQAASLIAYPAGDRFDIALDADEISRRARRARPLHILFLGNLIPRKGLHVLLDALARLPAGSWMLDVAGRLDMDPAYADKIREQIICLGLSGQARLLGPVTGQSLIDLFTDSHVLAVPSFYESFGMIYLEGMAFGLPAIATTAGAAHEIITHGIDGYLIEPGDGLTLAAHLSTLAADRNALQRMSLAARSRFDQHPRWEQTASGIRQFLLDVSTCSV